jgi:hypothetical protein
MVDRLVVMMVELMVAMKVESWVDNLACSKAAMTAELLVVDLVVQKAEMMAVQKAHLTAVKMAVLKAEKSAACLA